MRSASTFQNGRRNQSARPEKKDTLDLFDYLAIIQRCAHAGDAGCHDLAVRQFEAQVYFCDELWVKFFIC